MLRPDRTAISYPGSRRGKNLCVWMGNRRHASLTLLPSTWLISPRRILLHTRLSSSAKRKSGAWRRFASTRRRRECINCGKRFTTYEYVETIEIMVRKKDGKLERFDVNKIIRGLQKACEKRPVNMDQINELASHVRQDLMLKGKEEITSQEIGDLVMKYLKNLDRIAYIRFASVYKQFEEPEDFRRLLLEVKK